ncbi:hypothetical protein Ddye_026627 [Dipteronia dyeriana]|uniref:Uncharacterized protein n=1 Tax=Dipteronia dyeriana TaxID=168575 RepID=A0AAD9TN28_9ROSI|nr:hypothetical protein Ddye_026627 [Dipteronia dyeriana]
MKDGIITQAGKNGDILNSGTEFMGLVGAHKQALSTLGFIEGGPGSERIGINKENGGSSINLVFEREENKVSQNDKSDDVAGRKGQLVQQEEREKGKVGFLVYWKYITEAYNGALVPFILLAQILFEILQIGSNYWMAWATPVSKDFYIALAIGSSFCILPRETLLVTAGYKTATLLFNKMQPQVDEF